MSLSFLFCLGLLRSLRSPLSLLGSLSPPRTFFFCSDVSGSRSPLPFQLVNSNVHTHPMSLWVDSLSWSPPWSSVFQVAQLGGPTAAMQSQICVVMCHTVDLELTSYCLFCWERTVLTGWVVRCRVLGWWFMDVSSLCNGVSCYCGVSCYFGSHIGCQFCVVVFIIWALGPWN